MALALKTITESIADLVIEGVTVLDKNKLKEGFTAYDCPVLIPRPNEFVSAPIITNVSFGSGSTRQLDVRYTLAYRYLHAPVGQGELLTTWSDMVDNLFLIIDAILANDAITGAVDFSLQGITELGDVGDGSNNMFHGCDIIFNVLEFVN